MEDSIWRAALVENIQKYEDQLRPLRFELRTKERLFAAASASSLRAGKYRPKNDRGQQIDGHAAAKAEIEHRLFELNFSIEQVEAALEDARAELATLPEPTDDGDSPTP